MAVTDDHLRHLSRYLDAGETVVWAGQPSPGRAVRSAFRLWLFALPWTLFALFWTALASGLTWLTGGPPGVGRLSPARPPR